MANKTIENYSKARIKDLNELLSISLSKNSYDTLHQIRIEIKKLHAISRFLEYCNIQFLNKKTTTILELIFSTTGKIRELQVALQLIKKLFPEMKTHESVGILKKRLEKYLDNFTKKSRKYGKIKDNSIAKEIKINKLKLMTYINLLQDSQRLISNGTKERPSMIHKIRVNLKDISYLYKLLQIEYANEKNLQFVLNLGEWHDLVSLRKLILKILAKNEFNELNTSQLILVIQKINRRINDKLEQLNRINQIKITTEKGIKKGQHK